MTTVWRPCFVWLFLAAFFAPAAAWSQAEGMAAMQAGTVAFRNNQLRRAQAFFAQALDAGLQEPRLYYNLGVVSYRLAAYAESERYFRMALPFDDFRQLAYYNLGRCAQQQGAIEAALRWYALAQEGEQGQVAQLAHRAGAHLRMQKAPSAGFQWRLASGFDSAVVGLVDQVTSQPTNESDSFRELFLRRDQPLSVVLLGDGKLGLAGYLLSYDSVRQADIQSLSTDWSRDFGQVWIGRAMFKTHLAHEWLNGQPFQWRAGVEVQLSHAWSGAWLRHVLMLQHFGARSERSSPIEGYSINLSSAWLRKLGHGVALLRFNAQMNDRALDENSPFLYGLEAFWRSSRPADWQFGPGLQWRVSRFPMARRPETRWRAILRLESELGRQLGGRVEFQFERNETDNLRYAYEHYRLLFGLNWSPSTDVD